MTIKYAYRLLRGLPVVGLHARALLGLVLLGSRRRPLRSSAGHAYGAVFHSVLVGSFRLVNHVFLGCCMPVRGVRRCYWRVSRRVHSVCSHFIFVPRGLLLNDLFRRPLAYRQSAQILELFLRRDVQVGNPTIQKVRLCHPSISKPLARRKRTTRQGIMPLLLHSPLPVDTVNTPLLRPSRFLTGALTGILANAKTMISEVCGSEHEVVGMSFVTGGVTAELQPQIVLIIEHDLV